MSNFLRGYSTTIASSDTPSPSGATVWTSFAGLVDVKPPAFEGEDIEISTMDSPTDTTGLPWKEFVAGWANGGSAEVKMQFEKSENATVFGLFRVNKGYKITLSDGSTWAFGGYIKKFSNEVEREKVTQIDAEIKVSGVPVFTPAG